MIDIGSLLIDAATLMGTGMAVVFIFLTILVYLVRLMSTCLRDEALPATTPVPVNKSASSVTTPSPQVVAAISAAVHQYRHSATQQ
ncbi:oxaloacetate decarboxylase subunit gamma [Vibrio metschnikovii]|nr:oxaloacetate decarboxylase subunit gamma [Vibrio metschnikovii]EKO3689991.1 oxaloacetate decarboxylase subunit gamma [Vibrio metschnikovii]EKO3692483.1 oxaloacetate decarboxylase subunit gamma [Vibrio metschnikovii]EKO3891523.1 oxaloacetate decarboxylase subunit gamma [Vibrio metschnikovii]